MTSKQSRCLPEVVLEILRARIGRGQLETWLTSSSGRSLAVVTNTERAMVMLLEKEGDPGEGVQNRGSHCEQGFLASGRKQSGRPLTSELALGPQ